MKIQIWKDDQIFMYSLLVAITIHTLVFCPILSLNSKTKPTMLSFAQSSLSQKSQRVKIQLKSNTQRFNKNTSFKKDKTSKNSTTQKDDFDSNAIQKENKIIQSKIVYPRLARKMGWEGLVKLEASVRPGGTVSQTTILDSSSYPILDRCASKAVYSYKFPSKKKSQNIILYFDFHLKKNLKR